MLAEILASLHANFPSVDDSVLSYAASTLADNDFTVGSRLETVHALLESDLGESDPSLRRRLEASIPASLLNYTAFDNATSTVLGVGALRLPSKGNRVTAPAKAHWDVLPEIVLSTVLGEWTDALSLVRAASSSRGFAKAAAAALVFAKTSTNNEASSNQNNDVTEPNRSLGHLAYRLRGTRLVGRSGTDVALPTRRRLPGVTTRERLTSLKVAGDLLLIGSGGRTKIYAMRVASTTMHPPASALVGNLLGAVDTAAAHGFALAVAQATSSNTVVATYDFSSAAAANNTTSRGGSRSSIASSSVPRHTCSQCLAEAAERSGRLVSLDLAPSPWPGLLPGRSSDGHGLVVLSAAAARSGKRTVVKLRCAATLAPLKSVGSGGLPALELAGRYSGAVFWGCSIAVAVHSSDGTVLSVWAPARLEPLRRASGGGGTIRGSSTTTSSSSTATTNAGAPGWTREESYATWPRRSDGDVEIRCGGGGGGNDLADWSGSRQRLLVWTRDQACPCVSVWNAGHYEAPMCAFRLALSAQGELLTSHIASDSGRLQHLTCGSGVVVLDGCLAHELLLLLTSDGCLRAWPLHLGHKPLGAVPTLEQTQRNLPVPLLKLRWTLRHARVVLTGGGLSHDREGISCGGHSIDVILHGTQSLRFPALPLQSNLPSTSGSCFSSAYDPGPFEWISFSLDRQNERVNDSSFMGLNSQASQELGAARSIPRCLCGVACTVQPMDTMRGRQTLLTCAVAAAHKNTDTQNGRSVASSAYAYPTPNKRGCGLSIWADEALSSEAI